ncbi:uncharacterized protein PG986_006743 [Apiospora aurea]|uniref:NB-ARC domain-containing protein n=1 Tax=Apiospora aurea TaxID=335848 RepID=A0ABR1QBW9_9PEZI
MEETRPPDQGSAKIEVLQSPPNPHFASRNWELTFLDAWLSQSGGRSCVIGGLPGVGKTQLVNKYLHQFCDDYGCIIWLPAGNMDSMLSVLKTFCHRIGIASETSDLETCAKAFKDWQSTMDWTAIKEYLPTTHGSSLVTTRDLDFLTSGTHHLKLESLDAILGAELFCGYLKWEDGGPSEDDQKIARAVSEELGGLPMALAHVAGYITKHDLSLETMVTRLRNLRPEGRALLEVMAFFNADQVPQYFWKSRIKEEPQKDVLSKALEDLEQRELVHRRRIDGVMHLSTHRALQKTMLCRLRRGTRLYSCALEHAIAMLHSACPQCGPFGAPTQDDWLKYDRVNKNALGPPKRTGTFEVCNRAIALRKEFPTEDAKINDLWLSDANRSLGRAFLETSDLSSAEKQLLETFILLNKHSGPSLLPYGFAAAYETLSLLRMSEQRPSEALELIDKAIATAGMVQKPNAAVFLQLTFNRAMILFNLGDFKEAWKVAKANFRSGEALWGKESSSALSALFWAAHALFRQKLLRKAERNLRDLLRKSAENQHWPVECVARARYLLAETLKALGEELEEAMELRKEAAETIKEDVESVTMADFDVRISIYYGRAIGGDDDDDN